MNNEKKQILKSLYEEISSMIRVNDFKDDEDLVGLGMNSLMIMKISAGLGKRGIKITFAELIEEPNFKTWKEKIAKKKITYKSVEINEKKSSQNDEPFELTDVQYAYWVGRRDDQTLGRVGCHAYFEIDGQGINPEKLNEAWKTVQMAHPMLRAEFTNDGMQKIMDMPYSQNIKVFDLRKWNEQKAEAKLKAIREEISHRRLNVEKGEAAGILISLLPNLKTRIHFDVDLLVADVFSISIIINDLAKAYKNEDLFIYDKNCFKEYLIKAYKNYPAREREKDRVYWQSKIAALPQEPPSLPIKRKPEMIAKTRFSRRKKVIKEQDWANIKKKAANHQMTPSMFLLTCYALVLERWCNQEEFLINIPLFDRSIEDDLTKNMVADFTNLLLLEFKRKKDETFLQTHSRIRKNFVDNIEHSRYSGIQVQRDIFKVKGDSSTIAPVVFACNVDIPIESDLSKSTLGNVTYMISQTPQVWLDFQTFVRNGELILCWDVVDELYPENLIDDMLDSLYQLIMEMAQNEDWDIVPDVLPDNQLSGRCEELNRILPLRYPDKMLYTDFVMNTKLSPESTAVINGITGETLTYEKLYTESLKLASDMIERGIAQGEYIGIILPRGEKQIYAIFAVLFAGCVYVPINLGQPKERRLKIYNQIGIRYVISDGLSTEKNNLSEDEIDIINIDKYNPVQILGKPIENSPADSAYIIMTSGSTGTPKGVEISHRSAVNTIDDLNKKLKIHNTSTVLMVSAIDFDLSVYDIFGILSAGGTVIVLDDENFKDPETWLQLIERYGVNIWNSVPILFDMLVTMAEGLNKQLPIKIAMLSGDWIGIDLPGRFYNISENAAVVAMGGATEASIWSNYLIVPGEIPENWISIPYGKALGNQVYRVIDKLGRICPDYVPGELWIGGAGVAKGYRGDEKLTKDKFVSAEKIRWYRTGDLGKTWADGTIEFLGRMDNQVKIKGHRIELGEIEDAVTSFPGVKNAIVDTIGTTNEDKKLIAFVETFEKPETLFSEAESDIDNIQDTAGKILEIGKELLTDDKIKRELDSYIKETDRLCGEFILRSFNAIGLFNNTEERYNLDEIFDKGNIAEDKKDVVREWLTILSEDKIIKYDGNTYIKLKNYDKLSVANTLKQYCGYLEDHIKDILQGKVNSIEILYGNDKNTTPVDLLKQIPGYEENVSNSVSLIESAIHNIKNKNNIKVIDLSNREPELVLKIASVLNDNFSRVDYTVLDNSLFFKEDISDVNFKTVDLNKELYSQGLGLHQYDLVLAFNSLHRLKDISFSLDSIMEIMKPGGILIGSEFVAKTRLKSISASLLEEGLAHISDFRIKSKNIIPNKEEMEKLFREKGFAAQLIIPDQNHLYGNILFITQNKNLVKRFCEDDLKLYLEKRIPEYMIPNTFEWIKKIPMTSNGKADRKALKMMSGGNSHNESFEEVSLSNTENSLKDIWGNAFNNDFIKVNDNYFAIGGDSLIATKIISLTKKIWNVDISISGIFENPTIKKLSKVIDEKIIKENYREDMPDAIVHDSANRYEPFPLTDIQYAYWIGRSGIYDLGNVSTHCYFELETENVNSKKIEKAWNKLIKRHDMLRAVILPDGEQKILKKVPEYSIETYDLRKLETSEKELKLLSIRAEMSHQILDVGKWPIFDVRMSLVGERKGILHISFDNIILDGWSMFSVLNEWSDLYHNPNVNLTEIGISFRDYVLYLESIKKSEKYEKDKEYWLNKLEGISPAPGLPVKNADNNIITARFSRKSEILNSEIWGSLKKLAKKMEVTPTVLLITAFAEVLKLWSESPEFTINLTRFERTEISPEINNLIGDFTSLILIDIKKESGATFSNRARAIQKQLFESAGHYAFNTIEVIREIRQNKGNFHEAIMPVVFTSGLGISEINDENWVGKLKYMISQTPQTWIDFQVIEKKGELCVFWDFVEELFMEEVISEMFESYISLLNNLCQEPAAAKKLSACIVGSASAEENAKLPNKSNYCVLNKNYNYCPNFVAGDIYVKENPHMESSADAAAGYAATDLRGRYLPGGYIEILEKTEEIKEDIYLEIEEDINFIELSGLEKEIGDLWVSVLGTTDLGANSNFFECGGDSLKAVKLSNSFRAALGINFPVRIVFKNPTIKDMAEYISCSMKESDEAVEGFI